MFALAIQKTWMVLLLFSATAYADAVNNEWYSNPSSLSKGNTGIASSDDPTTAMFYNPAGLSKTKQTGVELFNLHLEMGTGSFTLTPSLTEFSKNLSLEEIQPKLNDHRYVASSFGASSYPNLYTRNFAFGLLGKTEMYSLMDNLGTIDARSRSLLIPTMGFSAGLRGGFLRMGVAVRAIQITDSTQSTSTYTNLSYNNNATEGFGFGADAGILWTFLNSGLGTLGLVARNIGDTSLSGSAPFSIAGGSPPGFGLMKRTYDAGISFTPRYGKSTTGHIAIDYRDVLGTYSMKAARKVNFGTELNFAKIFSIRLGVSRGYFTGGLGVNSRRALFEVGTYSEEMNPTSFRLTEDRRIYLRFGGKF